MDTNVNVPEKKKKEDLTESRARRLTNKNIKMKKKKIHFFKGKSSQHHFTYLQTITHQDWFASNSTFGRV